MQTENPIPGRLPSTVAAQAVLEAWQRVRRRDGGQGIRPMTPFRLNMMVYMAHGWSFARFGRGLVRELAEAWNVGPMYPRLRKALADIGPNQVTEVPIGPMDRWRGSGPDEEETTMLEDLCRRYLTSSEREIQARLRSMGGPWSGAWNGGRGRFSEIDDVLTAHYNTWILRTDWNHVYGKLERDAAEAA